jgi:serine protease inhibitor
VCRGILLDRRYRAGFKTLDFFGATENARRTIDRWEAKRTADRIKKLISRGKLNEDWRPDQTYRGLNGG